MSVEMKADLSLESLNRHRIYLLASVVTFFLLDRFSKDWVQSNLVPGETYPIIPQIFHLTFVHNKGAAFSLFSQHPLPLLIFTSALFLSFLVYCLAKRNLWLWEVRAFGLILGGALGNIADRFMMGRVVDFLDFVVIDYPIFNLADVFIFIGVTFILIEIFHQKQRKHR
ncbi:MAG: signal peptidase II [Cyanobacteria bacterium]|nr:signal peptidase II [Cyanobacteriota bacterium]